jgi:hypothetical protein
VAKKRTERPTTQWVFAAAFDCAARSRAALLRDRSQDLLLIFDDGLQAALIFQNGRLVLLYCLLILLDFVLISEDRALILKNFFLVGDNILL